MQHASKSISLHAQVPLLLFARDTIHLLKHNEILLKGNPLMAAIDDHIDPIEP